MRNQAIKIYVLLVGALLSGILLSQAACEKKAEQPAPPKLSAIQPEPAATQPTEQARKETPPPNVKIKRDKEGVYTWDITGKDVNSILEADRVLRRRLAAKPDGEKP